tara:strand:- start:8348 stop:9493 length:1146 start_codon:yes stop_codon:yes gene_type:complete
MSYDFKGGSPLSTRQSFLERRKYKESVEVQGINFLDTLYEKPNYGLLNKNFEPVIINTDENFTNLSLFSDGLAGIYGASFVTRIFENFQKAYESTIDLSSPEAIPYIDILSPKKAYINFDNLYTNYLSSIVNQYANLTLTETRSLPHFADALSKIIEMNVEDFAITKSGFLLSNNCPLSVSGLTIDLADLDPTKDDAKSEMLNSSEFKCYAELASESGFYVDKNVPWRLIANLESPIMRNEILRYAPNSTPETILDKTYRQKTHYEDISSIYFFYVSVYQEMLRILGVTRPYLYKPELGDEFLISTTLKTRMLELNMDKEDYKALNKTVLDLHRTYSDNFINRFKPASSKMGSICSEKIKEIYLAKLKINSYNETRLKDYL